MIKTPFKYEFKNFNFSSICDHNLIKISSFFYNKINLFYKKIQNAFLPITSYFLRKNLGTGYFFKIKIEGGGGGAGLLDLQILDYLIFFNKTFLQLLVTFSPQKGPPL